VLIPICSNLFNAQPEAPASGHRAGASGWALNEENHSTGRFFPFAARTLGPLALRSRGRSVGRFILLFVGNGQLNLGCLLGARIR